MKGKYEIKQIPRDTDATIQMGLYNSLIHGIQDRLYREVSENYDDLVFSMLNHFDINKSNWRENVDRVEIIQTGLTKHFYIDGEYRFSIMEELSELIFDEADGIYKYKFVYKVEVIENTKGKCDE